MALLQTAPRFHPTMKLFYRPPRTVLVHSLPGLLDARHRQRTQQDPFQGFHLLAGRLPTPVGPMFLVGHTRTLGFLLARWLRLPHAHHPDRQGITSSLRALLGREQVQTSPTELDLGRAGASFVFPWPPRSPRR